MKNLLVASLIVLGLSVAAQAKKVSVCGYMNENYKKNSKLLMMDCKGDINGKYSLTGLYKKGWTVKTTFKSNIMTPLFVIEKD